MFDADICFIFFLVCFLIGDNVLANNPCETKTFDVEIEYIDKSKNKHYLFKFPQRDVELFFSK